MRNAIVDVNCSSHWRELHNEERRRNIPFVHKHNSPIEAMRKLSNTMTKSAGSLQHKFPIKLDEVKGLQEKRSE